jgi:hypothetical protein
MAQVTAWIQHVLGLDRCADMNPTAFWAAVGVITAGTILLAANVAVVISKLTNHDSIAQRIIRAFSYFVWVFRVGGGDERRA